MILVLGSVIARENRVEEALALSREHVERSRAEPGCVSHAVYRDPENPLRLVFVEEWETSEALWEHFKVPASREFARALAELASEAPSIAIYDGAPVQMPGGNAA
ncbi:MAG: putative quinol monooxygenase [Pyrinomonadaceae bacterium]